MIWGTDIKELQKILVIRIFSPRSASGPKHSQYVAQKSLLQMRHRSPTFLYSAIWWSNYEMLPSYIRIMWLCISTSFHFFFPKKTHSRWPMFAYCLKNNIFAFLFIAWGKKIRIYTQNRCCLNITKKSHFYCFSYVFSSLYDNRVWHHKNSNILM